MHTYTMFTMFTLPAELIFSFLIILISYITVTVIYVVSATVRGTKKGNNENIYAYSYKSANLLNLRHDD